MAEIKIVMEGIGAEVAAEALVNLPGVTGSWMSSEEVKRSGELEAIAAIVGIIGGGLSAAEQIRKWYQEYHGSEENKIENVVIVSSKGRLLLDEATPEEIVEILKELAKEQESR